MDVGEFVRARLDEREVVARAAVGDAIFQKQTGSWIYEQVKHRPTGTTVPIIFAVADEGGRTQVANFEGAWERDERAAHIVCHDPDRVIADITAKRKIVAYRDELESSQSSEPGELVALDDVVACLAQPFADHPDYEQKWDDA